MFKILIERRSDVLCRGRRCTQTNLPDSCAGLCTDARGVMTSVSGKRPDPRQPELIGERGDAKLFRCDGGSSTRKRVFDAAHSLHLALVNDLLLRRGNRVVRAPLSWRFSPRYMPRRMGQGLRPRYAGWKVLDDFRFSNRSVHVFERAATIIIAWAWPLSLPFTSFWHYSPPCCSSRAHWIPANRPHVGGAAQRAYPNRTDDACVAS